MSYDPTHSTPRDRLRFLVGDTKAPEIYSDTEYDAVLGRHEDFRAAAVEMLRSLIGEAAKNIVSLNIAGALSIDWNARIPGWKASLQSIEAELKREADDAAASSSTFGSSVAVRGDLDHAEYVNPDIIRPWGD